MQGPTAATMSCHKQKGEDNFLDTKSDISSIRPIMKAIFRYLNKECRSKEATSSCDNVGADDFLGSIYHSGLSSSGRFVKVLTQFGKLSQELNYCAREAE